ncbi:hypothetical protein GCM10011315_31470 [Roseovarius pacificus]|nr:hypothetical protein GCM10011315_31470 [Roseovarius pacificus]
MVQRHDIGAAQTKIGAQGFAFPIPLPLDGDAHNPAPCATRVNDKIEAIPVAMPTGAKRSHQILGQFAAMESHVYTTLYTTQ